MSVIWIYAANASRFEQDFESIAEAFRLPGRDHANTDVLGLVCYFLEYENKNPWLMIVDNVDNNEIFNATSTGKTCLGYIPDRNLQGRVLFTSRNREVCLNLVDEPVLFPPISTPEASYLLGQKAVQGRLETRGVEDRETCRSIEHLAWRLTELGRYSEAEKLYLQALPNIEQSCGIQSRYFLDVARDFSNMYERRLDFVLAEKWFQHVAIGCEVAFGLRGKSTMTAVESVARILYELGRYADSEETSQVLWSASESIWEKITWKH